MRRTKAANARQSVAPRGAVSSGALEDEVAQLFYLSSDALSRLTDQPECRVVGNGIEHPRPVSVSREKPVTVERVQAARGVAVLGAKHIGQVLHRRLTILQREQK